MDIRKVDDERAADAVWIGYEAKPTQKIFGKPFDKPVEISVYNEIRMEEHLEVISAYITWLSDCEEELIDFYNEEFEDEADGKWYDSLEVYRVLITINREGKIFADITCGDNFWQDHLLDIAFKGKEIESMGYDG